MTAQRADFEFPEAPSDNEGASSFIFPPTERNLSKAVEILLAGGLVAIPTETVYGLAANALDQNACKSIFELKGRPLIDPLIVHLGSIKAISTIAELNATARLLAETFMPGALTLVLPKKNCVPEIVTAGKPTVAVRFPSHPVFQELMAHNAPPLAAPSANPFGYVSPSRALHVLDSFPKANLPILDGGACEIGIESTIVDVSDERRPRLLRYGNIPKFELEEALKTKLLSPPEISPKEQEQPLSAPGLLDRHYSPTKPARLIDYEGLCDITGVETARVFLAKPTSLALRSTGDYWLSEAGNPAETQRNLYHLLRTLDRDPKWQSIFIEKPTSIASFDALRDRLNRATK